MKDVLKRGSKLADGSIILESALYRNPTPLVLLLRKDAATNDWEYVVTWIGADLRLRSMRRVFNSLFKAVLYFDKRKQ